MVVASDGCTYSSQDDIEEAIRWYEDDVRFLSTRIENHKLKNENWVAEQVEKAKKRSQELVEELRSIQL